VTTLRASQIETLERVDRHSPLRAYELSLLSGRPLRDSEDRLNGLVHRGYLEVIKVGIDRNYLLTPQGRAELSRRES
jgi:hypothetical protein